MTDTSSETSSESESEEQDIERYQVQLKYLRADANYKNFSRLREYSIEPEIAVNKLIAYIQMYSGFLARETQLNDFLLQDFDNLQKILYKLQFEDQQKRFLKNAQLALSYSGKLQRKKKQGPSLAVIRYQEYRKIVEYHLKEGYEIIIMHRKKEEEQLLMYYNYIKEYTTEPVYTEQDEETTEPKKKLATWIKAYDKTYKYYADALQQSVVQALANLYNMQKMREKSEFIKLPSQNFD